MPSYEQLLKVVQICHALSDLRQDILLFLFDEEMQEFFILGGKTARRDAIASPVVEDDDLRVCAAK